METSFANGTEITSKAVMSLFIEDNTGIILEELDEYEISTLRLLVKGLILNNRKLLDTINENLLLQTIRNFSNDLFTEAVEGLALIAKQNNLTSLKDLDLWLAAEEERCLGFLKPKGMPKSPTSF